MASDKKALEQINAFIDTKYIPLDNKIKLAIFVAIIILPIGLYYYFAYTDNVKQIENLEKDKTQLQSEITKAKKAAQNKSKIEASLKQTQELFRQTATVLPKEKEIPGLLTNISDLGQRAPLELQTFKPGGEQPKDFYSEIPISINITGPYHNIGYFLDQVSKMERIVTVDNITLGSAQRPNLSASLRMVTYRFTGISKSQPQQTGKGRKKR